MADQTDVPAYLITGDKEEFERLNYQHKLLGETFGGLYRSPLVFSKDQRVLDIGCGTGNWAIDLAKAHPYIQVLGFDIKDAPEWKTTPANCKFWVANLHAEETWRQFGMKYYIGCGTGNWAIDLAKAHPYIQVLGFDIKDAPEWKTTPANCKFWVADLHAEETWRQFGMKFNFIHGRMMTPAVHDWPMLIHRCFEILDSGGWIELQDQILPPRCEDDISAAASPFLEMGQYLAEGATKMGLSIDAMDRLPDLMRHADFSPPVVENYRMIAGPWPENPREKHLGEMGLTNFKMGTFNLTKALMTKVYGWSEDKHREFVEGVLAELDEGKHRLYWPLRVCFAQKPVPVG